MCFFRKGSAARRPISVQENNTADKAGFPLATFSGFPLATYHFSKTDADCLAGKLVWQYGLTELKHIYIVRSILKKAPKEHNLMMSSTSAIGFSSSPVQTSTTSIHTHHDHEAETEASSPVGIGFSSDNENTLSPQSGMI